MPGSSGNCLDVAGSNDACTGGEATNLLASSAQGRGVIGLLVLKKCSLPLPWMGNLPHEGAMTGIPVAGKVRKALDDSCSYRIET